MTQNFLCPAKADFRRNTICIARNLTKLGTKKDKSGSVLEVSEEVYCIVTYIINTHPNTDQTAGSECRHLHRNCKFEEQSFYPRIPADLSYLHTTPMPLI